MTIDVQLRVELREGQIVVHFGQPVDWIALSPEDALILAECLRDYVLLARMEAQSRGASSKPRGSIQ